MQIVSAKYIISSAKLAQCPEAKPAEFAFIGRSNVGKSSLINMLCNVKGLAKTSATPGKTQLINHFEIKSIDKPGNKDATNWMLVDLPGYGYAKTSQSNRKQWSKMIEEYIRQRQSLLLLFVLIDSRHEPQKIDLEFISDLGQWQIPFVLVFTKEDKNKPGATKRHVAQFVATLKEHWEEPPPYFISSAVTKTGRDEILGYINFCLQQFAGMV